MVVHRVASWGNPLPGEVDADPAQEEVAVFSIDPERFLEVRNRIAEGVSGEAIIIQADRDELLLMLADLVSGLGR